MRPVNKKRGIISQKTDTEKTTTLQFLQESVEMYKRHLEENMTLLEGEKKKGNQSMIAVAERIVNNSKEALETSLELLELERVRIS